MKRFTIIFVTALYAVVFLASCRRDEPDPSRSVITPDQSVVNSFDKWLKVNYVTSYNINFLYKMKDIESDISYTLAPADYKKSTQMARIVKHLCLEAYDEITGSTSFICEYFPKMFHLIGSAAHNSNGTIVLGTAEGGLKITLYMVNDVDIQDVFLLNYYYFHTIHHEFAHILHQRKNYPEDYQNLSGKYYVQDSWVYNTDYLNQGFVTAYSSKEPNEDFVEVFSTYITSTVKEWNDLLSKADDTGRSIIEKKIALVKNYMQASWHIDMDALRSIIERRSGELDMLGLDKEL